MRQSQTRQRCLWTRLNHHRAPRRQRRTCLAQNHRDGEIPWHERHRWPDRLLDDKRPPVRRARHGHRSRDPLRLACKPPREAGGIVELAVRLGERLAGLVGEDLGKVVARLDDQTVPFEEQLGASAGVDLAVGLESFVGGLHGGVDVFGAVIGTGGKCGVGAWVDDFEALAGFGPDPFRVDVGFGLEEVFVGELEREGVGFGSAADAVGGHCWRIGLVARDLCWLLESVWRRAPDGLIDKAGDRICSERG